MYLEVSRSPVLLTVHWWKLVFCNCAVDKAVTVPHLHFFCFWETAIFYPATTSISQVVCFFLCLSVLCGALIKHYWAPPPTESLGMISRLGSAGAAHSSGFRSPHFPFTSHAPLHPSVTPSLFFCPAAEDGELKVTLIDSNVVQYVAPLPHSKKVLWGFSVSAFSPNCVDGQLDWLFLKPIQNRVKMS